MHGASPREEIRAGRAGPLSWGRGKDLKVPVHRRTAGDTQDGQGTPGRVTKEEPDKGSSPRFCNSLPPAELGTQRLAA